MAFHDMLTRYFARRDDGRAYPIDPPKIQAMDDPGGMSTLKKGAIGGGIITAAAAFAMTMADIYRDEGGYVNDPTDRGGETNYGVTIATARAAGYLGAMKDFPKHCYNQPVCADKIYNQRYVQRPGFLPMYGIEPAIADKLVNTGVNMGPKWPTIWFQQAIVRGCCDIAIDGRMGPKTVAAYREMQAEMGKVRACNFVLDGQIAGQRARYLAIIKARPSQAKYRNGWLKRASKVRREWCGRGEVQ